MLNQSRRFALLNRLDPLMFRLLFFLNQLLDINNPPLKFRLDTDINLPIFTLDQLTLQSGDPLVLFRAFPF